MNDSASIEEKRAEALSRFPSLTSTSLSGETDDPDLAALRDEILSDTLAPEAFVLNHLEQHKPGFLATYTLMSELPEIAHIAEAAVEADRRSRSADIGGPWVIFTARPGERYALENQQIFEIAVQMADQDIACDLDMYGTGYCVTELEMLRRHKITYSPKVGKFLNQAFTFPLFHQDHVVLSRICFDCWVKLVKQYKLTKVAILNPWQMF